MVFSPFEQKMVGRTSILAPESLAGFVIGDLTDYVLAVKEIDLLRSGYEKT